MEIDKKRMKCEKLILFLMKYESRKTYTLLASLGIQPEVIEVDDQ